MQNWPFISQAQALLLLRLVTPALFMAHAAVRIINGTIPQFGGFMEAQGFAFGIVWVWAITIAELIASAMIIAGVYVRYAVVPLLVIASVGIILIHRHLGWFVGEHGTGGSEYSVALIVMLLVLAAGDRRAAEK